MASLHTFVRMLLLWIFENNEMDLIEQTDLWATEAVSHIGLTTKIRYVFNLLHKRRNIPTQFTCKHWDAIVKALFDLFECNILVYYTSSHTPVALKENKQNQGTLEITIASSATQTKEFDFRYVRDETLPAAAAPPSPPTTTENHVPISPTSSASAPTPRPDFPADLPLPYPQYSPPLLPFQPMMSFQPEDINLGFFDDTTLAEEKTTEYTPMGVSDASVVYTPTPITSSTTTKAKITPIPSPSTGHEELNINIDAVDGDMISIIGKNCEAEKKTPAVSTTKSSSDTKKSSSSPSGTSKNKKHTTTSSSSTISSKNQNQTASSTNNNNNKDRADNGRKATKPKLPPTATITSSSTFSQALKRKSSEAKRKPSQDNFSMGSCSSSSDSDTEKEPDIMICISSDEAGASTSKAKRKSPMNDEATAKKRKIGKTSTSATIRRDTDKADEYIQGQIVPLSGFPEATKQKAEDCQRVYEDYSGYMQRMIKTAKDRANTIKAFTLCNELYSKMLKQNNSLLQSMLNLPATLEEDYKNAQKMHSQVANLTQDTAKSAGCSQKCGSCCTVTFKNKLKVVKRADDIKENFRKNEARKRKKEQQEKKAASKKELDDIKEKFHKDDL